MRDYSITLIVLIGCVATLRTPYIGVLLWSWLGYMNPHRLAYGFAHDMPFAQVTAIVLIGSMLFSKQTERLPINGLVILWILFILFMGLTTIFAYFPEEAWLYYRRVLKIQLIVFITMMLITDMKKLTDLLWVISVSIGYYSVKGGIFTIHTGGGKIVWGPEGSFIEGNNELAIATLMIIPLMLYLHRFSRHSLVKKGLMAAVSLSFIGALGTQSRGALLAFAAVMFFLWTKSDKKFAIGIVIALLVGAILTFMPESWYKRMNTIQHYDEDASALGRLNAWEYAFNVANHHFLGAGFESWNPITFLLYAPNPADVHAAHSIYFMVLADHGWIGLSMFVMIFYWSWKKLKRLIRNTDDQENLLQINFLAKMLQVSLIAYLVGGTFLSLSYFDLPWHMVSFIMILEKIYANSTAQNTEQAKFAGQRRLENDEPDTIFGRRSP